MFLSPQIRTNPIDGKSCIFSECAIVVAIRLKQGLPEARPHTSDNVIIIQQSNSI